jgi:DNA-binding MarR family transcriptional regulator
MKKKVQEGSTMSNYKEPYHYTGFLVWVIGNILSENFERSHVNKHKMLSNHFMVLASLFWLLKVKEKVNQRTLASYTHLREITVSTIVKKLALKKYVTIVVDKTDKRSKSLMLTETGLHVLVELLDDVTKREQQSNIKALSGLQEKLTILLKTVSQGHI